MPIFRGIARRCYKKSYAQLSNIIFPPRCLACNGLLDSTIQDDTMLCTNCLQKIEPISAPICQKCGVPMVATIANSSASYCSTCMYHPPPYTMCRSLFVYNDIVKTLIMNLKFNAVPLSLLTINALCKQYIPPEFAECDTIVPVPLHPARLRRRGYNQSLLLCRIFFAENNEKIATNLLQRSKNTIAQSKLNRNTRLTNLQNVFTINKHVPIEGRSICLIDDVYTTGSTVMECSKKLVTNCCSDVFILTLARALTNTENFDQK